MDQLKKDYALCAAAERKSPKSIEIVLSSVTYLENFLTDFGASTEVHHITAQEIRAFILYLRQQLCFARHPTTPSQERGLSGHTITTYLRSIRAFFSWLVAEGFLEASPFAALKLPRAPKKVIPTFSTDQIQLLLAVIDTDSAQGYRDYALILTFLDTGLRVSELIGLPLVVYLDSDAAQDITGHVFAIRGGRLELFQPWSVANTIDIQRNGRPKRSARGFGIWTNQARRRSCSKGPVKNGFSALQRLQARGSISSC